MCCATCDANYLLPLADIVLSHAELFMGQKPRFAWINPLCSLQHGLLHPSLKKPGTFAYKPEFCEDFSTIEFHHTPLFHLLQLECGPEKTVIGIFSNQDGTMVTKDMELDLFYVRVANILSPFCFDSSAVHICAVMPQISSDNAVYGGPEQRIRAEQVLHNLAISTMFEEFNKASKE